jgi:hypothetical protein
LRIKDEIKFLHAKKQHLNHQIYHLYLSLAKTWNNTWPYIQRTIEEKLQKETQSKYKNLDNKLNKLTQEQTTTPREKHTFHPKVINNTSITFSDTEMALLQKGPKYNLHSKRKNWLRNLALEAETAVTQLPTTDREFYRKLIADRINTLQNHSTPHLTTKKHPFHEFHTKQTQRKPSHGNNSGQRKFPSHPPNPTIHILNSKIPVRKQLPNHQHRPHQSLPSHNQNNKR